MKKIVIEGMIQLPKSGSRMKTRCLDPGNPNDLRPTTRSIVEVFPGTWSCYDACAGVSEVSLSRLTEAKAMEWLLSDPMVN